MDTRRVGWLVIVMILVATAIFGYMAIRGAQSVAGTANAHNADLSQVIREAQAQ